MDFGNIKNMKEFAGILAFDKWTGNADGRQVVFHKKRSQRKYTAAFIDFGYCFNAGEWSFPDSSLRGAYARQEVYAHMAYGAISNRGYRGSSDVLRRSCRVSPKTFQSNGTEIPTTWIVYWIHCLCGAGLFAVRSMISESHTEIRFLIGSWVRQRARLRIAFGP